MLITRKSQLSGKIRTLDLDVTEAQMERFEARLSTGEYLQDIFSNLSSADREFILTGIPGDEWNETFNKHEEEEYNFKVIVQNKVVMSTIAEQALLTNIQSVVDKDIETIKRNQDLYVDQILDIMGLLNSMQGKTLYRVRSMFEYCIYKRLNNVEMTFDEYINSR